MFYLNDLPHLLSFFAFYLEPLINPDAAPSLLSSIVAYVSYTSPLLLFLHCIASPVSSNLRSLKYFSFEVFRCINVFLSDYRFIDLVLNISSCLFICLFVTVNTFFAFDANRY